MTQTETKWLIEAPENILVEALPIVGLDPNAMRVLVGPNNDAAIVYPSFFVIYQNYEWPCWRIWHNEMCSLGSI